MRRALVVVAAIALAVFVAAVAAFVLAGPRIAERVIPPVAEGLGYRDVELTVGSLGLRELGIERLAVGPAPGLVAEDVRVAWTLPHLLAARVASVEVGSATLHGEWGEAGVTFPVLPPAEEEGPLLAPPAFDRLTLAEGRIELAGDEGPVTVRLRDVDLGAPPGERLRARAEASVERPAGPVTADVDLVLDGDRVSGTASLVSADGSLDVTADLGESGPAPGRFPDVAGVGALKAAGRLRVKADGADLSPLVADPVTADADVAFGLEDGRLSVAGEGIDLAGFGAEVSDLDVDLAVTGLPMGGPGERLHAKGTASLARPKGRLDAKLDVVLDGDRLAGRATLATTTGTLDVTADLGEPGPAPGRFPDVAGVGALKAAGRLHVKADGADLSPLVADPVTADADVAFALEDGRLAVAGEGIELAGFGAEVSDLAVDLAVTGLPMGGPGERLHAKGTASLARPKNRLAADLDLVLDGDRLAGRMALATTTGTLDLTADLGEPGPAPGRAPSVRGIEDLAAAGTIRVKANEANLEPFVASLTANGTVEFSLDDGRLRLRGDGIDLAGLGAEVDGLDLAVELSSLTPPAAPRGQTVSVRTVRFGMDVGGGALRFAVEPDGVVDLESLDWRIFGGALHADGRIDPTADTNELVIGVEGVDLASLVGALGRTDLAMTGRVGGKLPLRIEGDRIFARDGRLTAGEAGGVIRYQSGGLPPPGVTPPSEPPKSGSVGGMQLVVDALRNFHYRTLEVGVDGELTGQMVLRVTLEGSNPDVYDGYPFQLNLSLEGPLADVIEGGSTGFKIQDAIEDRLRKREEGR